LLTSLGEISFSVYLMHAPVLALLALVVEQLQLRDSDLLLRITMVLAVPTLVFGAAILVWRFVEVPGRLLLKSAPRDDFHGAARHTSATVAFWLLMVVAMTFSETAADVLSATPILGHSLSLVLLLTAAISMVVAEVRMTRWSELLDWGLVLCVGMAGTLFSDFLDTSVGLGDLGASAILVLTLLGVHPVWRVIPPGGVQMIERWKAQPVLNWLTAVLAAALCTSLGDLMAEKSGLQDRGGALLILACLLCIALAAVCTTLPRRLLFWAAFVLIRPLGVTFGDALSKSHANGGLEFGAGPSSIILAAAMIVLIPIAGRQLAELVHQFYRSPNSH
jgi:uncharacterized membrane-anchored protein